MMQQRRKRIFKQSGAATLLTSVLMLSTITFIIFAYANYSITSRKISNNTQQAQQAYEASEAGLEYGFVYLLNNYAAINATASSAVINDTLPTTTLTSGATYSVNYKNPTTSDYTLINIIVTGTSKDGTSTRVIQQKAKLSQSYPSGTLTTASSVSLVGGATLTNSTTTVNITSGGAVTINNGATTYINGTLSSQQGNYKADVVQNVPSLASMTEPNFFVSIFGGTEAAVEGAANLKYTNTQSGGDYSSTLSGVTGKSVYINQTNGSTVTLGNGVTVGSSAAPVLLFVNGNINIANGVTFYGFIYTSGTAGFAGGAKLYGGIASFGPVNISNGVGAANYTKYSNLGVGTTTYPKVPGTWKDF